jgi:hypothetical protein
VRIASGHRAIEAIDLRCLLTRICCAPARRGETWTRHRDRQETFAFALDRLLTGADSAVITGYL